MSGVPVGHVVAHVQTQWNDALITMYRGGKEYRMEVDGAVYAIYGGPKRKFHGYYWDMLAAVPLGHARAKAPGLRVLMIGLGGGTALHAIRALLPEADLTVVEIDPEIVDVARKFFAVDDARAKILVGDGYAHVDANQGVYDVILDDAFLAPKEVTRVEMTAALVSKLRRSLRVDGIMAVNVMPAGLEEAQRVFSLWPGAFQLLPALGGNSVLGVAPSFGGPEAVMHAAERVQAIANAEISAC